MAITISHNSSTGEFASLKAIPIMGIVTVEILDSNNKSVGTTKCNTDGEWLQSFSLSDGEYTIVFTGNFHPIGQDRSSRYLTTINSVRIPISVVTPIVKQSISELAEVGSAKPEAKSLFYGDGTKWSSKPAQNVVVDLTSNQTISGQKTFENASIFNSGITIGTDKEILFGTVGKIYSSLGTIYYSDSSKTFAFKDIPFSLSGLSDVQSSEPTLFNVLVANGQAWISVAPKDVGIMIATANEEVSGIKTFLSGISFSSQNKIFDYNGNIKLQDVSGEYLVSDLAKNALATLSDVSDGSTTEGNMLIAKSGAWASVSPLDENFMKLDLYQIVSGRKYFSSGIEIDLSITGSAIDSDLFNYGIDKVPSSKAVVDYVTTYCPAFYLKLDGSNGPITGDLEIVGDLLIGGDLDVIGILETETLLVDQILGRQQTDGSCNILLDCDLTVTGNVYADNFYIGNNPISSFFVTGIGVASPITSSGGITPTIGFDFSTNNTWTGTNKINTNSTTAFFVEQDGINDNTFIVDTTNGTVGFGVAPGTSGQVVQTYSGTTDLSGITSTTTWTRSGAAATNRYLTAFTTSDQRSLTSGTSNTTAGVNYQNYQTATISTSVATNTYRAFYVNGGNNSTYTKTTGIIGTYNTYLFDVISNNNQTFNGDKNVINNMAGMRIYQTCVSTKGTSGTLTENMYGLWFPSGQGITDGGWTTNFYAIRNDAAVAGMDTAYFLYNNSTYSNFMGLTNCLTYFGTSSASYINYDGTNLIIVPDNAGSGDVVIGKGTANKDYSLIFDGETNDGSITWMEDENYFKFNDNTLIDAALLVYFRDTAIGVYSQADSYLNIFADGGTRIGDSTPTNYTQFDSTGHQTMVGTAKPWDDVRVEPVARTSGTGAPTFEKWYDDVAGTSRGVFLYSFTDEGVLGNEKEVFFTLQMPHNWDMASIHLHVHWVGEASLASSTPRWGIEYAWVKPGGVYGDTTLDYATGNEQGDASITAHKHYITEFTAIAPGSTANGLSSILIGRIFRSSSNAGDTYNTYKCGLLYIDAHYQLDSLGSTDEYTK